MINDKNFKKIKKLLIIVLETYRTEEQMLKRQKYRGKLEDLVV